MKKIKYGFIHGSADMVSVADIDAIELAKEECEKLIFGVYSDELYAKRRGKKPTIPCSQRIELIEALKDVDYAIEIKDEKQLELLLEAERAELSDEDKEVRKELKHIIKQKLSEKTTQEKPKQYKVGFIQGTFDMFHIGHYNLIKRALTKCDELIIGVNSDELVKSYKNKTPIVSTENRVAVLSAVKGVSKVVAIDHRDKIRAAKELGFDVLLMGDDWKNTDFYNKMEAELAKLGVAIVYFPYTKGVSSTKLRAKIGKDNNGNDIKKEAENGREDIVQ